MSMPIHPCLVHFPVAFLFLEGLLLALWMWKRIENYEGFSYFVLKAALFLMPFVALAGYIDAGGFPERVRKHFLSAVTLLALTFFRFMLRRSQGPTLWRGNLKGLAVTLLVASLILTGLTGHLGGMIVYGL
jgi:uncharacterized membrane protein